MKTSTALFTAAGLVAAIAGTAFATKKQKEVTVQKVAQHRNAEIATELLDRVQAMNSYQAIENDELEELLTDLHFFWNGARALHLLSPALNVRVMEFEAHNANMLEDLPGSFALKDAERHLINAAARLGDFLSENGEAAK